MYYPKCRKAIPNDASFCPRCGVDLSAPHIEEPEDGDMNPGATDYPFDFDPSQRPLNEIGLELQEDPLDMATQMNLPIFAMPEKNSYVACNGPYRYVLYDHMERDWTGFQQIVADLEQLSKEYETTYYPTIWGMEVFIANGSRRDLAVIELRAVLTALLPQIPEVYAERIRRVLNMPNAAKELSSGDDREG